MLKPDSYDGQVQLGKTAAGKDADIERVRKVLEGKRLQAVVDPPREVIILYYLHSKTHTHQTATNHIKKHLNLQLGHA